MTRRHEALGLAPGLSAGLALAVATLVLAGWRTFAFGHSPASGIEAVGGERLRWVREDLGPLGVTGDLDRADVVVVGDSRVAHGVHLSITGSLGLGEVALVWLSSATLESLLEPLLALEPPRDLVVSLAPLGLVGYPQNLAIAETLRAPSIAADPSAPPRAVREWAQRERVHLEGAGFAPDFAARTVAWWLDNHRLARRAWQREQRWLDTAGFDERLGHRVDRARAMLFDPLEPQVWQRAWFKAVNVRGSDAAYRRIVAESRNDERARGAEHVAALLAAFQARGWRVACVRLPIDPGLRTLEDSTGCAEVLAALPRDLGLPYRDFGAWPDATTDGSHLHWRAADRLTRELAAWLRDDLGWGAAQRKRELRPLD
ncbi:MAG: hypothetical protein R3F49_10210 [Planctomycetota bacterium]